MMYDGQVIGDGVMGSGVMGGDGFQPRYNSQMSPVQDFMNDMYDEHGDRIVDRQLVQ